MSGCSQYSLDHCIAVELMWLINTISINFYIKFGHSRTASRALECRSRGPRVESTGCCLKIWAFSFTSLRVFRMRRYKLAPFNVVSVPGEVKDPTQGSRCSLSWTQTVEKETQKINQSARYSIEVPRLQNRDI